MPAIEESIFAGVPINVTLLFSCEQYLAAAEAYLRGIERRIAAGRDPRVARSPRCSSAAGTRRSSEKVPAELRNRLGIAIGAAYLSRLSRVVGVAALAHTRRAGRASATPAVGEHRHQGSACVRHACTSKRLAAPDTIDTMPEKTLRAFADHGQLKGAMAPRTAATPRRCWRASLQAGIDIDALAIQLAARRRAVVRQVLAGTDAAHRRQEQGARRRWAAESTGSIVDNPHRMNNAVA